MLTCEIEAAINPDAEIVDVSKQGGPIFLRAKAGTTSRPLGKREWTPPPYTATRDAAATLEPADAQEVCVRRYQRGMYVRITLADGRPVYCEAFDRPITEPMARCAAALRARAAMEKTDG